MIFEIKKNLIIAFAVCTAMTVSPIPASAELPTADELATHLGFPDGDKQKVLDGKFVSRNLKSSNDRELAVALVFFVPVEMADIRKEVEDHVLSNTDPEMIKWAEVKGDGTLDDFKALDLAPDPDKRAKLYANAEPGSDLNLSTAEIAEFKGVGSDTAAVTAAVKKQLLARHQAYRAKGLAGIAPYDRGGESTPAGGDLKSATETLSLMKESVPDFYNGLLNYPADKPAGIEEEFSWSNYTAHGEPVFILTHDMQVTDGDALLIAMRQFYVSGSYNVGQAVVGALPVKGGTAIFYTNRTSTDQVTGFGSSTKKSMGGKVMASQLEKLYEKVRANIEKGTK